ncbi:hypothetical protein evm_014596, partial [Chilo suppressalis]
LVISVYDGSHMRKELVINVQPQSEGRAELPVTTENWQSNPRGQFIPRHGLDFLIGVSRLIIKQTIELNDRKFEATPNIYLSSPSPPSSSPCTFYYTANVLRANKRCQLYLVSHNLRYLPPEFLLKIRFLFQEMKVITPPGDYVGRIQQQWTWMVPFFLVREAGEEVIFVIEGPSAVKRSALLLSEFKILTKDALREVGKIAHGWDREVNSFTTTLTFPDSAAQPKHKALLLAAAFLL